MKKGYLITAVLGTTLLFAGCGNNAENTANSGANTSNNTATNTASSGSDFSALTESYRTFVIEQCDLFVQETEKFTNAVKAGDIAKAQDIYAPARMYYERIEPIAEALGDLDPNIDAREGDVEEADWRGFHRIEKGLWVDKSTEGLDAFADQLLDDSKLLRAKVETVDIEIGLLVTGAVELLNEVSSSKVTGEEERYSHTDLYDFAANVEGADKIFEILKPELEKKDSDLAAKITQEFSDLFAALEPFKSGDGYILYTELTEDQTRSLSQELDALAEPLSQMGTILEA